MALAWLELAGIDRGALRFTIDTGTSRYYQLRVGRARASREGFDWVDDVYLTTPMKANDAGGSLLPATRNVTVPASRLDRGDAFVQLVSFKTPDGRGPAFSQVIPLPSGAQALGGGKLNFGIPYPVAASMTLTQATFQTPRRIPCVQSPDQFARETSLDDLLSGLVKVAAPVVLQMLGSGGAGGASGSTGGGAGATGDSVGGVVTFLLKTLLSGLQPGSAAAANSPAPVAKAQSFSVATRGENRFVAAAQTQWSRPFIFGIDDALLATLAGPLLNVLPQLVNAANQARLQAKQTDNKLVTDALAQVNQRMLMEQLLQAQQKSSGDQAAQLAQLKQLLDAASQAAPASPAASGAPAKAQSLSMSDAPAAAAAPAATPSQRAILTFVSADPLPFNGTPRLVFSRDHDAEFKVKFTVGDPVPKNALPRAILTLTFKGSHRPTEWVKSIAKLKDVTPNGVLTITLPQADLAKLPANRKIAVVADLRWPSSHGGTPYCATGTTDIVLVGKYFVKERGASVGDQRELTDMAQFRPFWNKVWEAPPLDAMNKTNGGRAKSLWELDVDARYMVILTSHEEANGVMETKLQSSPVDPDALSLKVDGRLKGGVELSIAEVNKLSTLWTGQTPLDADHLAALESRAVAHANSGEFISHIKLNGRAGERGMVWIVPVFQMAEFTLSSVQKTDDSGQVVSVTEEKVRFPLPVAARVLGLRSQT